MTTATHNRFSYEACGQRLAKNPRYIARITKAFWLSTDAHIQEQRDIRTEERADGIDHLASMVKRYPGEDGNFSAFDSQIAAVRALASDEAIADIIGPIELDTLTMRECDLLADFIRNGQHLNLQN